MYEHTQQGRTYLIAVAVVTIVAVILVAIVGEGSPAITTVVFAIAIGVAVLFRRLTVSVDAADVRVAFGTGWPRRTIALADIRSVTPVRNRWYHGWGIRKVANGWMYNVWGLDAVELELSSGRVFRIGTDEPRVLAAAIESRLGEGARGSGRSSRWSY